MELKYYKTPSLIQIIAVLFIFVTLTQAEDDTDLAGCSVSFDGNIFDLSGLKRSSSQGDYEVSYNAGDGNVDVYFNICEYTYHQCSDLIEDYGNMVNENNTCTHLTSDHISDIGVTLIDENFPDMGVVLNYTSTSTCSGSTYFQFDIQLNCDEDEEVPAYSVDTSQLNDPCYLRVIMSTVEACPVATYPALQDFFDDIALFMGIFLIALGGFLIVLGGKLFRITLMLTATFITIVFLMLFFFLVLFPFNAPDWVAYLCLVVATGMGVSIGYAAQKWYRVGLLIMGSAVGFILGLILFYGTAGTSGGNAALTFWLLIILCTITLGLICIIFFDYAIIIFSAIIGSYLFVRGFSIYIGGYPSEVLILTDIKNGTVSDLNMGFFIYIWVMGIIATVSIVLQISNREKNQEAYDFRKYDFKYRRQE